MGTLMGHILPGSFFLCFALWWSYSILCRYFRSRLSREDEYYSTVSFPCSCLQRLPLEGILKVIAVTIGILGETITGFENGHWAHMGNAQHISMFFFFGLTGVLDILYFYKFNLPNDLDYATSVIAFLMEGLLFANHLHGRSHMDVQVHTFLLYVILGCALSVVAEARYRRSIVAALSRCYFTLLQGTWFYQIGFILYPPPGMEKWDEENHDQMMVVTLIFSWHFALALLAMFGLSTLAWCRTRQANPNSTPRQDIPYQKIDLTTISDNESGRPSHRVNNGARVKSAIEESSEEEV